MVLDFCQLKNVLIDVWNNTYTGVQNAKLWIVWYTLRWWVVLERLKWFY